MAAYRVLVSHRDLKMKTVVHLEPTVQVQYLVDAGYLKAMEEVQHVAGTGVHEPAADGHGDAVGVSVAVSDVPVRRGRKVKSAEVVDEPDRVVPDSGPENSAG